MRTVLFVVAILLALIAAILDFGWVTTDDPHVVGLLALAFAAFVGGHLVRD